MFEWLYRRVLESVIKRTDDPQRLYKLAMTSRYYGIRVLAAQRIEDEVLLYSVLGNVIHEYGIGWEMAEVCLGKIHEDKLSQLEAIDNHDLQIAICKAKGHRPLQCDCLRCGAELTHQFGVDNICGSCGAVLTFVTTVERVDPSCDACTTLNGYGCWGDPNSCLSFVGWDKTEEVVRTYIEYPDNRRPRRLFQD